MADSTTRQEHLALLCDDQSLYVDNRLSTFLATFATPLHYSRPESSHKLFVFWSDGEPSDDAKLDPDIPDPWRVQMEIIHAFSKVEFRSFDGLIQFWSPVRTGSRRLLTTYHQPFALKHLDSGLQKYRLRSLTYQYNIDGHELEVEKQPTIITGAPVYAYINHLAEVVLDLRGHQGNPLVRSALECELMSCFVLPIFDPCGGCCVGVVECCAKDLDDLLLVFWYLGRALELAGLKTFNGQEYLPYKTIGGLKRAQDEIEEALKIVCESHDLTLAQVSITYEDGNRRVPFTSSSEDRHMKQMLALNLIAHSFDPDSEDILYFTGYCGPCDIFPLKTGEGLAEKALQKYQPHFCRNIYKMSNIELPATIIVTKRSCLVICLRSIHTGDLDYVFEFLWPKRRRDYNFILIEALISTLKRCLPNFKLASGAELGDELPVVDVGFSSKYGIVTFKIFGEEKLSPIPKILEKGNRLMVEKHIAHSDSKCKTTPIALSREDIEQQFGRTMKEAAENLDVSLSTFKRKLKFLDIGEWPGPKSVKRKKVNNLHKDQSDMNEEDNIAIPAPLAVNQDTSLTIKAEYNSNMIKFHLPISFTTFEAVEKEIGKKLKLIPDSFKLKYHDEDGEWILLVNDQDMRDCIKSSTNVNGNTIKLRVQ